MANIHIKTEERRQREAAVLRSYGVAGRGTPAQIVVVHGGQIVMDKGIGVDHLQPGREGKDGLKQFSRIALRKAGGRFRTGQG